MDNFEDHLNNYDEIKRSKKIGCLECCKISDTNELDWLSDDFKNVLDLNTYCPKCRVADRLIGDASGIELSESTLKKIHNALFNQ